MGKLLCPVGAISLVKRVGPPIFGILGAVKRSARLDWVSVPRGGAPAQASPDVAISGWPGGVSRNGGRKSPSGM